jgi:hypothetical protein
VPGGPAASLGNGEERVGDCRPPCYCRASRGGAQTRQPVLLAHRFVKECRVDLQSSGPRHGFRYRKAGRSNCRCDCTSTRRVAGVTHTSKGVPAHAPLKASAALSNHQFKCGCVCTRQNINRAALLTGCRNYGSIDPAAHRESAGGGGSCLERAFAGSVPPPQAAKNSIASGGWAKRDGKGTGWRSVVQGGVRKAAYFNKGVPLKGRQAFAASRKAATGGSR